MPRVTDCTRKPSLDLSLVLVKITKKKQPRTCCKLFPIGQNPKSNKNRGCPALPLTTSFCFLQRLQVQSPALKPSRCYKVQPFWMGAADVAPHK